MNILINNKFVDHADAKISVFSEALIYGFGLFETLRTYHGKKVLLLDKHIQRLLKSAQKIGLKINYDFKSIQDMTYKVIQRSEFDLQRIKLLAIPDMFIILSSKLMLDETINKGIALKTYIHNRSLPEIKSTSYLDCLLYHKKAVKEGYYDALLLDKNNLVHECTRSNIFWISDNKILTRKDNVLPGVTRELVHELAQGSFKYASINLEELLRATEIFITNSIIGIVPVIKINDKKIVQQKSGKITSQLMQRYDQIIQSL